MKTEKYNWWDDPKNKEEVERISWWNHPENKEAYPFPISVVRSGKYWVVGSNDETKTLIGNIGNAAQGNTKEEAISKFFEIIKWIHEFEEEERRNYQRFVPFRKGDWTHTGGSWFTIFGINFYFRRGKNMHGGWYIPFTKMNISIHSEWATYRQYKKSKSETK